MNLQRGAALLLFMMVMFVVGIASWLARASLGGRANSPALEEVLAEAKSQVLVHAVGNGTRPGWLPYPDRHADGNYDGSGDCISSFALATSAHLIGQWPFVKEEGCVFPVSGSPPVFASELRDPGGNRLWISLSKNLVWNRSGIDDTRWLSVRTPGGVVTRVAAVIIAPGAPLAGQRRYGAAAIGNFLEATTVEGSSASNADGDLEFVSAPVSPRFNDQLVYVTAGEFMTHVTRRVSAAIGKALDIGGPYPSTLPSAITPWYDPFWSVAANYQRLSPAHATLHFQGCPSLHYHIEAGAPVSTAPAGARC